MANCVFCNREEIQDDILYETTHFLVKVGFGLIAPGHVLLIPKQHYRTFADLPEPLEAEFEGVKENLKQKITSLFSEPILLEDGNWRQSVKHAHIHFIPSKSDQYEVKSLVEEMCLPGKIRVEKVNRRSLKEKYLQEGKYISIEESGNLYFCHVQEVKDQGRMPYLSYRAFFTEQKGIPDVLDWQSMSPEEREADEIKRRITKERLKPELTR